MPEATGEWTRIEIPASLLRAEQGTVTRLDINYAGGQMWFDRFGKNGTACVAAPAPPPALVPGDAIWVDDSVPAGAQLQNGYHGPVHWDPSQKASGTQALVNNWSGAYHYESYVTGLAEWMEIGDRVVAHFMINECAVPREIQLVWDTDKGTHRAFWGEALVGGENGAVDMGPVPSAGQWVRVELPSAPVVEQVTVRRIRLIHHGGQVWFDRLGKNTTP